MASAADEGGAGGKLRRKPLRRASSATPYDRPASALRNNTSIANSGAESGTNGWLSRFIARGAQRIFSSVFRKGLPAPQTVSETNHEPELRDELPVAVSFNPSTVQDKVSDERPIPTNRSDPDGIDDLEKVLKQKTFTRQSCESDFTLAYGCSYLLLIIEAEIDHLTELLRSRTVDAEGHQKQKTEPSTLRPVGLKENGPKVQNSTGDFSAQVFEDDIASPAEIAKAYMGRSSRFAPSPLGLRGQSFGGDVHLSRTPFPSKSPCLSIAPRSAVRVPSIPGVSENTYTTPARRGRSAIYSMARTPYSRVSSHTSFKGVESVPGANVIPLSSQWSGDSSGSKQASKRRSSVLENDISSIGPIRRIRQKTNLVSPFKSSGLATHGTPLLGPATTASADLVLGSTSSNRNLLPTIETKHNTSSHRPLENLDGSNPDMHFDSVPSQSNEMARKILQQLDKLVPSPRERSSDLKLAASVGKAPAKLTPNMLHGQALKSMEDVDSSKLLHNIQNADSSNCFSGAHLPGSKDLSPQKQIQVKENGPSKASSSGFKFSSETNGTVLKSVKETLQSDKAGPAINFSTNLSQKKQGFKISAHEDFLEFDDNTEKEKLDSSTSVKEKLDSSTSVEEKLDLSTSVSKANGNAVTVVKRGILSETMAVVRTSEDLPPAPKSLKPTATPLFGFSSSSNSGAGVAPLFGFSSSSNSGNGVAPLFGFSSSSNSGTGAAPGAAPLFGFNSSSNSGTGASPFPISSASALSESLSLKFDVQTDSKLELSTRKRRVQKFWRDEGLQNSWRGKGDEEEKKRGAEIAEKLMLNIGNKDATEKKKGETEVRKRSAAPEKAEPSTPAAETDKGDKDKAVETGNLITREDTGSFIPATPITSPFSFAASLNNSAPKKDSLPPSGSLFPALPISAAPSSSLSNAIVSSASTNAATATIMGATVSISPASPIPPTSLFQFGSSTSALASSNSAPLPSSTSALSTTPKLKAKETSFSSLPSSSFGASSSALVGTGNGPFAFGSSAPSTSTSTTPSNNPFQSFNTANASSGSLSTQEPKTGTGNSPFSQNMPLQFGSTASAPIFGSSGSSPFSSGSSLFSSSSSSASAFGSVFGSTSSMNSSGASSFSFGAAATSSIPVSSSQSSSSAISSSTFGLTSSPGVFSFGFSSGPASTAGSVPTPFGSSSIGSSSGSMFSFTSAPSTANAATPPPIFPTFGSTPPAAAAVGSSSPSNDQMNMEDSMAEDTMPLPNPVVPVFGQAANNTPAPSNFTFGSPMPSGVAMFPFGGQQNSLTPQAPPATFQLPGNELAGPGGSFSLGTGGDKSNRKMIKVNRTKLRKR
ncbi:hypothetical protein Syun_002390 [Stephania yunnanensis]|uniref:Nuclear pore complex protein NUP1 n=1 Tax=Stephania yunnanensis TaxID=152371 RepID=A0AAP0LIJ1_9MAGN